MKPQTIQILLPEGAPTFVKEAELTNRLIKKVTLYVDSIFMERMQHE